jgi:hypothetical protein
MKKTKLEQVVFEAKPKESGDGLSRVEIGETSMTRNENVPNQSSFM